LLTYPTLSSILALFGRRFYLSGSIRVSPNDNKLRKRLYGSVNFRWQSRRAFLLYMFLGFPSIT